MSNRASDKITALADNAFLCRSGSAADTEAISDYVRHYIRQHEAEIQEAPDVETVANLAQAINYQNKDRLMGAMIVAGFDGQGGGQVFSLPIGGTIVQTPWAIDGSGSTYIWGYVDAEFREGMTRAETEGFVKTAVALAMARDGSSGGVIRLVTVTKDGAERSLFTGKDIPQFMDELPEPAWVGAA